MTPHDAITGADAILADLDGTLILGEAPAPGAVDLLRRFGDRLAVVSNYSTVRAGGMSDRLNRLGLPVPEDRIFLAGELAIDRIARAAPATRVLCLMTDVMRRYAAERDLILADEHADVVLLGRDLDFTYARLEAAVRAVHGGARIVTTNRDLVHPGEGGRPCPETGSLLAAILASRPGAPVEVVGKPQPTLFEAALARLGVPPGRAVMLGDNPDTDEAGATGVGVAVLLVGSHPRAAAPHIAGLLSGSGRNAKATP